MGTTLSKEDCIKRLEAEGFSLPDISIDSTLKQLTVQDVAISTSNTNDMAENITYGVVDGAATLLSKLNPSLPVAVAIQLGTVVLENVIEMGFKISREKKKLAIKGTRDSKFLLGEEKITELRDMCYSFVNYCRRYKDDKAKLMEELKIFQRKFGEQIERVKNALLGRCMTSLGLKVWNNAVFCHIDMLCRLGQEGHESRASILTALEIYREHWQQLIARYKRYKMSTVEVEKNRIVDFEQGKCVEVRNGLTSDDVVIHMFEENAQISDIERVFWKTSKKIALMEVSKPSPEDTISTHKNHFFALLYVIAAVLLIYVT